MKYAPPSIEAVSIERKCQYEIQIHIIGNIGTLLKIFLQLDGFQKFIEFHPYFHSIVFVYFVKRITSRRGGNITKTGRRGTEKAGARPAEKACSIQKSGRSRSETLS